MSKPHYEWRPGEAPPVIRSHSLIKHEILGEYLRRYVATLLKKRRGDSVLKLTLVDGFAGGGRYLDEHSSEIRDGSPLIILNAIREAEAIANPTWKGASRVDAKFVFIEKSKRNCEYLSSVIADSPHRPLLGDRLHVVNESFESQLPRVTEMVDGHGRSRRAIFILDQYGYSAVPLPLLRQIFAWSPRAEVILTFATDSLIDYLRSTEEWLARLEHIGLGRLSSRVEDLKEQEQHAWREIIQKWLHGQLWAGSGAGFYTPFFLHSCEAHRSYWLVHLSGHPRARDVMVGLHWEKENSFVHYGDPGLNMLGMLGYDPSFDARRTSIQQRFEFDGTAEERTMVALRQQLPERIASFGDGITYERLFATITNETPARSAMIEAAILEHVRERELIVVSPQGRIREPEKHLAADDRIIYSRQRRLFLPSSQST